jgi:hypothetical protein
LTSATDELDTASAVPEVAGWASESAPEPPPQAVRQARRMAESARAGVAFLARLFKTDPSMSWFVGGRQMAW